MAGSLASVVIIRHDSSEIMELEISHNAAILLDVKGKIDEANANMHKQKKPTVRD